MAQIDPTIALGFKMPQLLTPVQAQTQVMNLKDLQAQTQLRQQQVQQGMQTLKNQQQLSMLAADRSKNIDPETGYFTQEAINQIDDPMLRQKMSQDRMAYLYKKSEADRNKSAEVLANMKIKKEALKEIWEPAYVTYQERLKANPNDKQGALDAFNKEIAEGYDELRKTGKGGFSSEELSNLRAPTPEKVFALTTSEKEREESARAEETPFMKEAAARYGKDSTEYKKALQEHIAKLDAPSRTQINMTGGPSTLQGDALDMAANQLLIDGKMPAGFSRNSANVGAIYKRAAEIAKQKGETGSEALFNSKSIKADQASLQNLTKQADMISSFENTAKKNLDMLVDQSKKVSRTSFPLVNKAILEGRMQSGDPDATKLYAIVKPFVDEYAKILSGSTGSAGASYSARREAAEIIAPYMSADQIDKLAPFIKQELENRTSSLEDQRQSIKARMKGAAPAKEAAKTEVSAQSLPKTQAELKAGTVYQTSRGPAKWNGTAFEAQ